MSSYITPGTSSGTSADSSVIIKRRFCESLVKGSADAVVFEQAWQSIKQHYQENHRAYHTLTHIGALLELSQQYHSQIQDHTAVDLAILFHDFVYDPKSKTNEEDSAALFRVLLAEHINPGLCDKVCHYILETKKHAVSDSEDSDLKLFIDFDMSILGAEREEYAAYARQIRREYEFVPQEDYCKGRAAVLRSFLADNAPAPASRVSTGTTSASNASASAASVATSDASSDHVSASDGSKGMGSYIFATAEFRVALEDKARANIAWECEVLSAGRLV